MLEDPRPELEEDSKLWNNIFILAARIDGQLAYILHGFRCAGLRVKFINGNYVLRPEFNHNSIWESQEDYDQFKQRFMIKYGKEIVAVLNQLGGK